MGFAHPALTSAHHRADEAIPFTTSLVGCTDRDEHTVHCRYAGPGLGLFFADTVLVDGKVGFTNLHTP